MGQVFYNTLFLLNISAGSLLPSPQEHLDREWDAPKVKAALKACFEEDSQHTIQQGYARLYSNPLKDQVELRLERSTYKQPFIESCLQGALTSFRKSEKDARSWSYAHVFTSCEKKTCELTVLLNNFSENKATNEIVDGKSLLPRRNVLDELPITALNIINLIQLIGALSK